MICVPSELLGGFLIGAGLAMLVIDLKQDEPLAGFVGMFILGTGVVVA